MTGDRSPRRVEGIVVIDPPPLTQLGPAIGINRVLLRLGQPTGRQGLIHPDLERDALAFDGDPPVFNADDPELRNDVPLAH